MPRSGRSRNASSLRCRTSPIWVSPCEIKRSESIEPHYSRSLGSALFRQRHAGLFEGGLLAVGQDLFVEIVDQLMEQAVPINARLQMQEHRSEADRGAVHKDKGARRRDAAKAADVAMHAVGEIAAIDAASLLLDHPGTVVEQRPVNVGGPAVQYGDHVARQIAEPPAPIGIDRQRLVVCFERVVKVDDT